MGGMLPNPLSAMTKDKPQLIYVWNYLAWGGAQMYILSLVRAAKKEFDVIILLPEGSNSQLLKFIEESGARYEFFAPPFDAVPVTGLYNKFRLHRDKFRSENAIVRKLGEFDLGRSIVHIEIAPWQSFLTLVRLCRRTRVFVTIHNSVDAGSAWRRLLWRLKLGLISRIENFHVFTANDDAKNSFRGYFSDTFFREMTVTYACVNSSEISEVKASGIDRSAYSERFGFPVKGFLIFGVGQFIDRKGRWTFLEAAARVRETEPDAAFVWISNSAPSETDLKKAAQYGLGEFFVLLTSEEVGGGHIELMKLLRCADVFALPSFLEGLPISLLEAMALGVPSISTRVNAIPEVLRHRENGLLIEPGDASGLAEAIIELKNDPVLSAELGQAAAGTIEGKFTDAAVGAVALEKYKRAFD